MVRANSAARGAGGEVESAAAATTCPNDDLSPLLRWLGDQPDARKVWLVCHDEARSVHAPPEVTVVRLLGCAGELTSASYLEAAAAGATTGIELNVLVCSCPQAWRIGASIALANTLLAAWPGGPTVGCNAVEKGHRRVRVNDISRLAVSRRRLLFLSRLDHVWMPEVQRDQRCRTLAALRCLRTKLGSPDALSDLEAPSARLAAGECTACGVCVRACPSGALCIQQGDDGAGGFALSVSLASCVDCDRCLELCPSGTLTKVGQAAWARLIDDESEVVAVGSADRCSHCGGVFAGGAAGSYSPLCRFKMENPFGSRMPRALASFTPRVPDDKAWLS